MSAIKDAKAWAIAEQLKNHEKNGTTGSVEYAKLLKKYEELTGRKWSGSHDD